VINAKVWFAGSLCSFIVFMYYKYIQMSLLLSSFWELGRQCVGDTLRWAGNARLVASVVEFPDL